MTIDDAADALRCLDRLSLIDHDSTSATHTVRIHSLAQRATREQTPEEKAAELARVAGKCLLSACPDSERDGIGTMFRRNSSALLDHAGALIGDDEAFGVLLRVSTSLFWAGYSDAAVEHAQYVHALTEQHVGGDHHISRRARKSLASSHLAAHDHVNALVILQALLPELTRLKGTDHAETLDVKGMIAEARGESGEISAAAVVAELDDIQAQNVERGGPVSPYALAKLARWRHRAGDVERAVSDYQDLFADCIDQLGLDDPTTLEIQDGLIQQFVAAGDHEGAIELLQDLVPRMRRVYGDDASETLHARRQLAEQLGHSGDHPGALAELQELVPHMQRVYGETHKSCHYILTVLAHELWMSGKASEAIEIYQRLLDDRWKLFGRNDDRDALYIRFSLAKSIADRDGRSATVAAFAELLPDMLRAYGPDSHWTLDTRKALDQALAETGDPRAAASVYQQLHAEQEQIQGADHPETLHTRVQVVVQLEEAEDYSAARAELEDLVPHMQRVLGGDDPGTLSALCQFAWARHHTGDSIAAKAELEELVSRTHRVLGPDDPVTLSARYILLGVRVMPVIPWPPRRPISIC